MTKETIETPEQRRQRLKTLARDRVETLVGGGDVQPHLDLAENRVLIDKQTQETMAALMKNNCVEFPIRAHTVNLVRIYDEKTWNDTCSYFSVTVDSITLDDPLYYHPANTITPFIFKVPLEFLSTGENEFVTGATPFEVLFKVFGRRSTSKLLDDLRSKRIEREALAQRLIARITREAEQFRHILVQKHRQLVFRDEYDTLEIEAFVKATS